jgi:hypothetical protein
MRALMKPMFSETLQNTFSCHSHTVLFPFISCLLVNQINPKLSVLVVVGVYHLGDNSKLPPAQQVVN